MKNTAAISQRHINHDYAVVDGARFPFLVSLPFHSSNIFSRRLSPCTQWRWKHSFIRIQSFVFRCCSLFLYLLCIILLFASFDMDVSYRVVTWILIQIFAGFSERIFVLMRRWNRKSIEMRSIMATHFDAMKKNGHRFSWESWGTAKCKSRHTIMMDWWNHMMCQWAFRSIQFSS